MIINYSSFVDRIKNANNDLRVKISTESLSNNIFFRNIWKIHEENLPTLKITEPDVYDTISSKEIREVLVLTGLFQASRFKSPREEDLEIEIPQRYHYYLHRFHRIIIDKNSWKFEPLGLNECEQKDAIRIVIKVISTLFSNLTTHENPWLASRAEIFFQMTRGPYGKDQTAFNDMIQIIRDNLWKHKKKVSQLLSIEV